MTQQNNYNLLIQKLDEFTRKYYLNLLIRGFLYTTAILLSAYLLFSFLEYKLFLSTTVRKILFYGFIGGTITMIWFWIAVPLMKYFRLGKLINHETAAKIIGSHFGDVQDKLLNILQLKEQSSNIADASLIEAGINQKIEKIKPVNFPTAIDLKKNRSYLKYALPPLAILVFLLFAAPNILKDSNLRFLKNNTPFEKPAPFSFIIVNDQLQVVQYDDFELTVKTRGSVLPEDVKIVSEAGTYTMVKKSADEFTYFFNKVPASSSFYFTANGFNSKEYKLEVIPKPTLLNFKVDLNYPDYTGKKDEVLDNSGDLLIPEGTNVGWFFKTENAEKIEMFFEGQKILADQEDKQAFSVKRKVFHNEDYKIGIGNGHVYNRDTINYRITIIPDAYPEIQVEQFTDSIDNRSLYFFGQAADDYGFKNLNFVYSVQSVDAGGNPLPSENKSTGLPLNKGLNKTQFTHSFDLRSLGLKPGDRVTYFFEIWDNDGVHGSKSARTPAMQYTIPTLEELKEIKDENNDKIKDKLDDLLKDVQEIKKQTEKLEDKFFDKKELNWEDKKSLENLLQKNQDVQDQMEQLKEDVKNNMEMQKEFLQPDPELLQKQEQLEKLFDEVMSEEMKKLMEELQELLDKLNKEQSIEEMQKMEMNNQNLENELDRMLELFKQLEMEQKMQESIDDLKKLSEQQDKLSEQTQDKKSDNKENLEEQENINKEFEEIKKDLDQLQEMNKELEKPKDLENTDSQEKEIQQNLQKSSEQIQQNNKKQASQSQKSASEQMKQMAQKMESQMNQSSMEQQQEDLKSLRQLLDNLIKLSVDQEALMDEVKQVKSSNPKFVDLMAQQQKIKEDTKIVEDSLTALAKRVMQISTFITREMSEVNLNLGKSVEQIGDRQVSQANLYQQLTMTGYNNLALMLDEVMQQMQQQMAQKMPGSQMCQNPGGSNPSDSQLPSMSEMQKQLNEQMQKMKGEMQNGQQKGNSPGMSKELAEMAQKQAAIREALQKMAEQLGGGNTEDGKLAKQLQQIADKMDQTEEDIVNKQLSEETLKRQQDILTRLLEAEESDRQRKLDTERKSNTAQEISKKLPPEIEEYLKQRNAQLDLYKTVPPDLKPFYKNLVEDYFRSISY